VMSDGMKNVEAKIHDKMKILIFISDLLDIV
jgi:hypothetical protein